LRLWTCYLVAHPYFESFIYHLIALNSILLMIDEPVLTNEYSKKSITLLGNIISVLFIVECVLKIFVLGFIKGKHTYLKDPFNILDFVIVCFSILNFIFENIDSGIDLSYVRAFRALRALRPLKLVSKNEGMKLVVNSLLTSIPKLFNVLLISLLFYFVFGILGLQLLMGKISECTIVEHSDSKEHCLEMGGLWVTPKNHYDNIFASMITFFEISTLEMWPDMMFRAVDSADEVDMGIITKNKPYMALLFIFFIFITTFFVMNLFISVIVSKFNEEKQKTEGSADLSEEQKEWVKMQRYMVEVSAPVVPIEPTNCLRLKFFQVVESDIFDSFIMVVILLNTIVLCMEFYGASAAYLNILAICNYVFVAIFTLEAVLKLVGLGPTYYFYIDWNKFDFFIVILSLISLINDSFFSS